MAQPATGVPLRLGGGLGPPLQACAGHRPGDLFADILDALAIVWALDASVPPQGQRRSFDPDALPTLNTLTDIDETMGVWLFMEEAADPWKCFDPTVPALLNDLTEMGPGNGYFVFSKEDATLTVEG
ncbi:MAG: hypothetical protein ACE5IZ_07185 [Dehalococcoidia bacterium]